MLSAGRRSGRDADSGATLVELIVAMALLLALLGIFMAAVVTMSRATVRAQNTEANAAGLRRVYQALDRGLRSATAVNAPVLQGGTWYLEYQNGVVRAGDPPTCTQWKVDGGSASVSYRSWPTDVATPTATAWRRIADGVAVPSGRPPFTLQPAGATYATQRLLVDLPARAGATRGSGLQAQIVALNTSMATVTNTIDPATGASATQVCQEVSRS